MHEENRTEPGPLYVEIGRNILYFRKAIPITQAELAAKAGIGRGLMVAIEQGARRVSVELLLAIADVLGVSVTTLLPSQDTQEEASFRIKLASAYLKLKSLNEKDLDMAISTINALVQGKFGV